MTHAARPVQRKTVLREQEQRRQSDSHRVSASLPLRRSQARRVLAKQEGTSGACRVGASGICRVTGDR